MSTQILILINLFLVTALKGQPHLRQQDMVILINTGIGPNVVEVGKHMIQNLLDRVSISPASTRVGLVTYGSQVKVHCHLNKTVNRENVIKSMQKIRYSRTSKWSRLHHALDKASEILNKEIRYHIYVDKRNKFKTSPYLVNKVLVILDEREQLRQLDNLSVKRLASLRSIKIYLFSFENQWFPQMALRHKIGLKMYYYGIHRWKDVERALIKASRTSTFHGLYGICNNVNQYKYDECHRRCRCENGILVDCYRIRKEFTQLSVPERMRYINAFIALTTLPSFKIRFNKFTEIHQKFFCSGIHTKPYFLPWHRWYILEFENILRSLDCRLTVPYWDWAHWSGVSWQPGVHIWGPQPHQLGTDGYFDNQFCVTDGPFAQERWNCPRWVNNRDVVKFTADNAHIELEKKAYNIKNVSQCLRRKFNNATPTIWDVRRALKIPSEKFSKFETIVRRNFHNVVHNAIGGTMCTDYASAAPEFFMHHAILDKIWYRWQRSSLDRKFVYFNNKTARMTNLECDYSPVNLIDSSKLPSFVNVRYSRFPVERDDSASKRTWVWYGGGYHQQKSTNTGKEVLSLPCDSTDEEELTTAKEFAKWSLM